MVQYVGPTPTNAADIATKGMVDTAQSKANAARFVGEIAMTATATAPTNWLLCQGQAVSRTTYAALFTALGGTASPFGLPSSTTFNVPNLVDRVPIGAGTTAARGVAAGSSTGAIPVEDLPVYAGPVITKAADDEIDFDFDATSAKKRVLTGGAESAVNVPLQPPSLGVNFIIRHAV